VFRKLQLRLRSWPWRTLPASGTRCLPDLDATTTEVCSRVPDGIGRYYQTLVALATEESIKNETVCYGTIQKRIA